MSVENSVMDINSIPPEILSKIFSYLDQKDLSASSMVCKNWRELATDPYIWRKVTFNAWTSDQIADIVNNFLLVEEIVFNGVIDWSWITFLPERKYLRKLHFKSCGIYTFHIRSLVNQLPLIECVDITTLNYQSEVIDEIILWPKLKSLNITMTDECFDASEALLHLARISPDTCPSLKKFTLSYDGFVDHLDFYIFSVVRAANVTRLSLDCFTFWEQASYGVLRTYTSLSTLRLFNAQLMTNDDLLHVRELTLLKELHISSKSRVKRYNDPSGFENLFKNANFPNLTAAYIKNCDIGNTGLICLTKSCPNLKTLELRRCKRISNLGLQSIMTNCKNLETLYLIGLRKINGSLVRQVPLCLQKLKRLYVHCCPKVFQTELLKMRLRFQNIEFDDKAPHLPRRNEYQIEF